MLYHVAASAGATGESIAFLMSLRATVQQLFSYLAEIYGTDKYFLTVRYKPEHGRYKETLKYDLQSFQILTSVGIVEYTLFEVAQNAPEVRHPSHADNSKELPERRTQARRFSDPDNENPQDNQENCGAEFTVQGFAKR